MPVQPAAFSSAVWSPWAMYDVCIAIPCPVAGPAASATCRLMTRSVPAASLPGSGSLYTVAPAGAVTDRAPPNVSRRLLPGTSSAP